MALENHLNKYEIDLQTVGFPLFFFWGVGDFATQSYRDYKKNIVRIPIKEPVQWKVRNPLFFFFVAHVTGKMFPESTVGVFPSGCGFFWSGGGGRNLGCWDHSQVRWRVVGFHQKQMTWLAARLGGNSNIFLCSSRNLGKWSKLTHIFQMGLFNDSSNKKIGGFGVGSWVSRSFGRFWEVWKLRDRHVSLTNNIWEIGITILKLSENIKHGKNLLGFPGLPGSPLLFF